MEVTVTTEDLAERRRAAMAEDEAAQNNLAALLARYGQEIMEAKESAESHKKGMFAAYARVGQLERNQAEAKRNFEQSRRAFYQTLRETAPRVMELVSEMKQDVTLLEKTFDFRDRPDARVRAHGLRKLAERADELTIAGQDEDYVLQDIQVRMDQLPKIHLPRS